MDVGTGKATQAERQRVPHHVLDVATPQETFHAGRYAQMAAREIRHVVARGRVPLVVGGTGLYFRALTRGLFEAPPPDAEIRRRHREEAERLGPQALHARLAAVDAETAAAVEPRDVVRTS